MSSATYIPGQGVVLTIQGASEGVSLVIPTYWTIQAIERHVRELEEWLT